MIANKQTNKHVKQKLWKQKSMEKEEKQNRHVKAEAKQMKQKLGFLGSCLHTNSPILSRFLENFRKIK